MEKTIISPDQDFKMFLMEHIREVSRLLRGKDPRNAALALYDLVSWCPDVLDKSADYEQKIQKIFKDLNKIRPQGEMTMQQKRGYEIRMSQAIMDIYALVKMVSKELTPILIDVQKIDERGFK